ncbi:hypothetical protein PVAG01_07474 [Phlyctema vagabunda]|uniref:Uncharacterized protein n=1 Tax=Phlyctema vagabunda TaxID=108571 RepID=A0ABR4PCI6_9HELO
MDNMLGGNVEERSSRYLSVDLPNRNRSLSNAPSERSGITLITDDAITVDRFEENIKNTEVGAGETERNASSRLHTWLNHFRGVFCMKPNNDLQAVSGNRLLDKEEDHDSPWVLQVFVQSARKDDAEHYAPQWARCTFDTGNLQGNIVSKGYLLDVLGWAESSFLPLTDRERVPGISITGHQLEPEGAVNLTWYHRKSVKVFHNMRFLISPHSHYDLVIGCRSILKHNLVSVPNLMARPPTKGEILITDHDPYDLAILLQKKTRLEIEKDDLINHRRKQKVPSKSLDKKIDRAQLLVRVVELLHDLYEKRQQEKQQEKQPNHKHKPTLDDLQKAENEFKTEADGLTNAEVEKIKDLLK